MKYYSGVAEKEGITKEEMGAVQSIVMAVAAHKVSAQFVEAQKIKWLEQKKMTDMESIWKEYNDPLQGFIRKRISDVSVVEDILQEVFLKVHVKFHTLNDNTRIRSWIYRITRNVIIDYYRTRKETGELPETIASAEAGESEKAQENIARCIVPMIERMPDHYRRALMLSDIQGLRQRDLAEQEGLSLSGAKSRVQRGREMLKGMLLNCCRFEFDKNGSLIDYEPRKQAG